MPHSQGKQVPLRVGLSIIPMYLSTSMNYQREVCARRGSRKAVSTCSTGRSEFKILEQTYRRININV